MFSMGESGFLVVQPKSENLYGPVPCQIVINKRQAKKLSPDCTGTLNALKIFSKCSFETGKAHKPL